MQAPLQITERNMELPDETRRRIEEKTAGLERFYERITSCRVTVETPHRHKQKGVRYNVRIDLNVPGKELVTRREEIGDLNVAIRDAFDAARRQLEDYARRRRGQVKSHEEPPAARVARILPDEGYGFLETGDGREVYFHRNSVLQDQFDHLRVGTEVHFAEEQGEKGPQASTVRPVGKLKPGAS